jgi:uncharacterized protein YdaU (DUF1376 family)
MHYFQFEIKEWVSNTAHLSLEEEAIYLRLINYYYDSEQVIPLEGNPVSREFSAIIRKLRLTQHYEIAVAILSEFFTETSHGWKHDRCDIEINRYQAKVDQASRAGKASAQARFNSRSTDVQPIINHKSLTINQNKDISPPEGVDCELWKDYLKVRNKQKKPITQTAIKGLVREAEKAKISLSEVVQICTERGWIGFKAEWLDAKQTTKNNTQEWRANDGLMIAKAQELGLHTQGLQRYELIQKIDNTLRSRGL